ncbi:MAG: hypothetical protein JOZ55_07300 [Alphaproteobacteria bacterium]|nr:hypothetical protein [Alphaproteobacteria bacterium]
MKSGTAMIAVIALLAPSAAAGKGCEAILAAQLKAMNVPTRSSYSYRMNGLAFSFESIAAGGKVYSKKKEGGWEVQNAAVDATKIQNYWADKSCKTVGVEALNGEPASIILHHDGGPAKSDTRFWVSKASGLILKTEMKSLNTVLVSVEDYRDVHPPPGFQ